MAQQNTYLMKSFTNWLKLVTRLTTNQSVLFKKSIAYGKLIFVYYIVDSCTTIVHTYESMLPWSRDMRFFSAELADPIHWPMSFARFESRLEKDNFEASSNPGKGTAWREAKNLFYFFWFVTKKDFRN